MSKPNEMKQETWDYLAKFTDHHEAIVLHMYNNKATEAARQDVTCGVGFFLKSADDAINSYKELFFDPDTKQAATDDQIRADWQAASELLRKGWPNSNLESTPDGTGYADVCKLRMDRDKVIAKRNEIMASKIKSALKDNPELLQYYDYPAQAQVALASFCYGYSPKKCPTMVMCLFHWGFDDAGKESFLSGMSSLKVLHHRILFWNAARICEQKLEYSKLPLSAQKPELIPWQAWTTESGATIETAPAKPTDKK